MADQAATPAKTADAGKTAMELLDSKLTRQLAVNMHACVHCGLCFDSCHYYLSTGDPKLTPAYKAEQFRRLYKRRYDWMGRLFPAWVHASDPTEDQLEALYDAAFGSCTMCRRCNLSCPMGLDMGLMMRTARSILTAMGRIPSGLKATVDTHLETGNNMGISREDFVETVEWMNEELQSALGDPNHTIPLDKPGTKYLMCLNPREVKFYPLLFLAQFKTCYAAGEDWGLCSTAWDATNYGLFSGDDAACKQIVTKVIDEAVRLGAETLVLTECGHGYRVYRWEAQGWYGKPLPIKVMSYVELAAEHIKYGRIKLDPTKNPEPVTYHDPCNQARSGGIIEEPRYILKNAVMDFREMTPHGANNFCCGGGGGALTMSEFRDRRLEAGRTKAEQIRATGAKIVATSCHNCIDQLSELSRHYKLGVRVVNLCELVANALVMTPRERAAGIVETAVEVDENGFIRDPGQWTPEAAVFLARRQGYGQALGELTGDHWRVIDYIRSFRESAGGAPSRADVCAGLSMTRKQFYELFPGTLKTALRVAGLPAPEDGAERGSEGPAAR
jgi:TusE/DsrC/DsvC family sulfur relay protein